MPCKRENIVSCGMGCTNSLRVIYTVNYTSHYCNHYNGISFYGGNATVALSRHSIMEGPMSYPYLKSQYTKSYFIMNDRFFFFLLLGLLK